jgi:hypothetical protein
MNRDYDATPVNLLGRANSWYELSTCGINNPVSDFTTERYVALCFSIEFFLKALLCLDKNNAKTEVLKKYSHKLGMTKTAALAVVKDDNIRKLINEFFTKYSELEDRDVVKTRYGKLGEVTTYGAGMLTDDLYPKILQASNQVIRKEWTWRNQS